jgi:hypothetical protein
MVCGRSPRRPQSAAAAAVVEDDGELSVDLDVDVPVELLDEDAEETLGRLQQFYDRTDPDRAG